MKDPRVKTQAEFPFETADPSRPERPGASPAAFDLEKLRLPQNFQQLSGARRVVHTVQVRKPHRQEFIRVRVGLEWSYSTMALHLKHPAELYFVAAECWAELARELTPTLLTLTISTLNDFFLWPLRVPGPDGRVDSWSESAMAAAGRAERTFVRLIPNQPQGCYDLLEAIGALPEPLWPELSMSALLELAFKGRFIDSLDHPVVSQLLGKRLS